MLESKHELVVEEEGHVGLISQRALEVIETSWKKAAGPSGKKVVKENIWNRNGRLNGLREKPRGRLLTERAPCAQGTRDGEQACSRPSEYFSKEVIWSGSGLWRLF